MQRLESVSPPVSCRLSGSASSLEWVLHTNGLLYHANCCPLSRKELRVRTQDCLRNGLQKSIHRNRRKNPTTENQCFFRLAVMALYYSTWEAGIACLPQVCGQPELHSEITQSGPAWATEWDVSKSYQNKVKMEEREKGRKGGEGSEGKERFWVVGLCFQMEVNASVSFFRTDKTTTGLETCEAWSPPHKYPFHGSFPSVPSQPGYGSQASKSWGKLGLE